ncbi:MAG: hypothetical protein V1659_01730 [Candidatus Woesearchaeota archaeon]
MTPETMKQQTQAPADVPDSNERLYNEALHYGRMNSLVSRLARPLGFSIEMGIMFEHNSSAWGECKQWHSLSLHDPRNAMFVRFSLPTYGEFLYGAWGLEIFFNPERRYQESGKDVDATRSLGSMFRSLSDCMSNLSYADRQLTCEQGTFPETIAGPFNLRYRVDFCEPADSSSQPTDVGMRMTRLEASLVSVALVIANSLHRELPMNTEVRERMFHDRMRARKEIEDEDDEWY